MQPGTRNVRLDIRLTATEDQKQLLHATLTGLTPATDSVLSQMTQQYVSAVQAVMLGLTHLEMKNDATIS